MLTRKIGASQACSELEQGLMLSETKATLETPERRNINGPKLSDIDSMRHLVVRPMQQQWAAI